MGFRIKVAETAEEFEAVFRLRHSVYVAEEGYFTPRDDGLIVDRYDSLSTTLHVIAVREGNVVGAARFVEASAAGIPTDEFFDFAPFLPLGAHAAAGGMLCVAREHRRVPGLCANLMGIGFYWCERIGVSHVQAVGNALHRGLFSRVGFRSVGGLINLKGIRAPSIPMVLDVRDLNEELRGFICRQRTNLWPWALSTATFEAGEVIAAHGEGADVAYGVVNGRAHVICHDNFGAQNRIELNAGDDFGVDACLAAASYRHTLVAQERCELVVAQSAQLVRENEFIGRAALLSA